MRAQPAPLLDIGLAGACWRASALVIAAAVFLASYNAWRPSELLFTLSDGLFVVGAVLVLLAGRVPLQPLGSWTPAWLFATAAMLASLLPGSLLNGDPQRWVTVSLQYAFSLLILPMLLIQQPADRTLLFFKALVAGVLCMELFGLVVYFAYDGTHEDFGRFGAEFITGTGRLAAFLADANWNAAAIVSTIPFLLFLRLRGAISFPACIAALAVLLTALVCAASVTGLVSGILSCLIFFLVGRVRISRGIALAGAAALALLLVSGSGLPRAFTSRIMPALQAGDIEQAGTFTGRSDLIAEAWNMVEDTTFVGLGVDQYRVVSAEKAPVHNIYLLLWAEGGLLALVGWLVLMGLVAAIAASVRAHDRLASALAFSVFSTFVIFSNAAPHMYARFWIVPLLLALAPALQAAVSAGLIRPLRHSRAVPRPGPTRAGGPR